MRLSCLTPRRRPVNPARANVPRRGGIERSAKNLNGFAPAGRPEVGRARVSGALSFRLRLVAVSRASGRVSGGIIMRKSYTVFTALILAAVASLGALAVPAGAQSKQGNK